VTGHDRPELYALRVPDLGGVLEHVATIAIPTDGQAIAWNPRETSAVADRAQDQRNSCQPYSGGG